MPRPERSDPRPLTRAGLPSQFTPDALRRLNFRTLRRLAQPDNGVLSAGEQKQFDAALAEVMRGTASLVEESLRRAGRGGPASLDPSLRQAYQRTQQRLAEQAGRARERFPELAPGAQQDPDQGLESDRATPTEGSHDDDASPGTLEQEVQQTSETLDMLERIASLQQQQLEHQERQLLSETRGLFFAFVVSVAVIIAGVAPLVEAESRDRLVIVLWTVVTTAVAGLVYALVRAAQSKE